MNPSESRKSRKDALKQWKDAQRTNARAKLPLSDAELRALFDMLDRDLPTSGCDHSRRLTEAFLVERGHDIATVFSWLDENGGYCDCEVLANSEPAWRVTLDD